jgi:UDP-N-acetylmuramate dehydrogenase
MTIQEHIPLASYTTFKIGGPARFFCHATSDADVVEAVTFARAKNVPVFILGGGSNILIGDEGFDGLVIHMGMMGISEQKQDGKSLLSAAAGEQWDTFVEYAVERGLYGIENLSAIPGTVGAAPVQNIGAYGAEASETIFRVHALDTTTMLFVELLGGQCQFSYRDSLFKKEKGRYIITRVDFLLDPHGSVNTTYKDVADYFAKKNMQSPTIAEVREAVTNIRWGKLPDWKLWGTAGSFFKNPIISANDFMRLKQIYPELPGYPEPDGRVKVSLGWILDKVCNAKGLCRGNVCAYEKQALVLVSKPGATSEEVVALAQELMNCVKEKTGIVIEGEVEWVN